MIHCGLRLQHFWVYWVLRSPESTQFVVVAGYNIFEWVRLSDWQFRGGLGLSDWMFAHFFLRSAAATGCCGWRRLCGCRLQHFWCSCKIIGWVIQGGQIFDCLHIFVVSCFHRSLLWCAATTFFEDHVSTWAEIGLTKNKPNCAYVRS